MLLAAKEKMLSSFVPWCAEMCISAHESEGKKPHQGVATKKSAHFLGHELCNSTTALGLRGQAALNGIRSRCTGKERDAESGLDMFGARYYSSSLGRFITPDWAAKATAVPYANFGNPQSLNLYSYVQNNPTTMGDPDGHCPGDDCSNVKVSVAVDGEPKMVQNFKLGSDTYFTGVGGTLAIKFTDSKGNPIAGMPVKESNTSNGGKIVENPNALKTDSKGVLGDLVGKGHTESKPTQTAADVKEGKEVLTTNPVNSTTTQTLTFTTTGASGQPCTCQATYDRTLSNTDDKGKVSTQNNSNGVNYTLKTTQPVVKQKEPQ